MDDFITLIIFVPLYFLPTIVAAKRNHQSSGGIFALNLLLGWTMIGWIIALVWSCSAVYHSDSTSNTTNPTTQNKSLCPYCRANVDPQARKCPHCAEWIESQRINAEQ